MTINEILDIMEDALDNAWAVPLSGGKCVVDVDRFRELAADIRMNLPQEVKQAKLIVDDRKIILEDAQKEAEQIVHIAEERARRLVDENAVAKQAKQKASDLLAEAASQARELKRGAGEFSEKLLQSVEKSLQTSMQEVKQAQKALRAQHDGKAPSSDR